MKSYKTYSLKNEEMKYVFEWWVAVNTLIVKKCYMTLRGKNKKSYTLYGIF